MSQRVEFWSSVECGGFQRALVRELTAAGWHATSRYSVPLESYWATGGALSRLLTRIRAYGFYPAKLALRSMLAPRQSIAVVTSNTFFAPRVCQLFCGNRLPVVHWVFDLFPDVLIASGAISAGGAMERRLRRLLRRTFDGAAANVFLGEALKDYAESRFGPIPRAHVIPVGADGSVFRSAPPQVRPRTPGARKPRILYCGNLGRMHDVETVAAALKTGCADLVEFEFRGSGAGFRRLEVALGELPDTERVFFGGNLVDEAWVAAMREADVALVTMRREAEGLVMPSKAYSALVAGQAILAVCSPEADLARLVRRHDAGWVIAPGDVAEFRRVVALIATHPDEVWAKRCNAWQAGHECYDQKVLAGAWGQLLDSVAAPQLRRS